MSSSFDSQQGNFFKFPQPGADFSNLMYMPPSPYVSQQSQMCELVYTPVPTPGGVALTPTFVPVSPLENGSVPVYSGAPSPLPFSQPDYANGHASIAYSPLYYAQEKFSGDLRPPSSTGKATLKGELINGMPAEQWKSMSDQEREEFLRDKRRQEAYKTALCTAFLRYGECRYGNDCRFAHNADELRMPKLNHPKYKTVLCRNFAVTGSCPYGSRCQFIHANYTGAVPEEYIASIENTQVDKQPKIQIKTKASKNAQFTYDYQNSHQTMGIAREMKKVLQENNDYYRNSDWNETSKLYSDKKGFSRSCMPQLGEF